MGNFGFVHNIVMEQSYSAKLDTRRQGLYCVTEIGQSVGT